MKAGWERSYDWIMPDLDTAMAMLKPFLKDKCVKKMQPLSGGLNNLNIKITTGSNESFVLRVYSEGQNSMDVERNILERLKDHVPVPQVLYFDSSYTILNHPFLIQSWVDGVQLSELMHRKREAEIRSMAKAAGESLANIHHVTFSDSGFFGDSLHIKENIAINANTFIMFIEESLLDGYGSMHLGWNVCNDVFQFAHEKKQLLDCLGEQNALVHGDFNPLNILVNDGCISAILDWEYAFSGSPLMDIGNMLRYEKVGCSEFLSPFILSYQANGGNLPEKWLQKAKLLDLIALCGLVGKKECGQTRVADVKRIILNTMEEWDKYEIAQS